MDIAQQGFADWRDAFLSLLNGAADKFERKDPELIDRADRMAVQSAQLMAYRRSQGLGTMPQMMQQAPQQIGGIPVPQGMAPVAVHYAPAAPPSHFGGGPLMGPQMSPPPMQPMTPPAPPPPPNPAAATPGPIMPIRPGQ